MEMAWSRVPLKYNSYMKGRLGWQNLRADEYTDEGPFLVTGTHFVGDTVDWDVCYHVTHERYALDPAIQLRSEDVLITKDGSIGKIAHIRRLPGLTTLNSHLLVVRPLQKAYAPRFLYWCLISDLFLDHIELTKTGTTFHGVTQQAVGDFQLPVPPIPTQKTIADYLDEKTAAIDALIEKKRKLLDLLAEERAALINQAVTKGLDPTVPMKDSGIPWIGEIPAHWASTQLRYLSLFLQTGPFGSQLHADDYIEGGCPVVNPTNLDAGKIFPDLGKTVDEATANELSRHKLVPGDLVFARRGVLGRCGVVNNTQAGWLCGTGSILIRPDERKVDSGFIGFVAQTPWVASWLSLESVGSTMENLNTSILGRLPLAVPPRGEQPRLITLLTERLHGLDTNRELFSDSIDRLQEYRQSLITAAVTGQLDIEAAT